MGEAEALSDLNKMISLQTSMAGATVEVKDLGLLKDLMNKTAIIFNTNRIDSNNLKKIQITEIDLPTSGIALSHLIAEIVTGHHLIIHMSKKMI
jgi:hypothetical protein